jgi:uncharacterized protein (TIGR02099 family)
MTLRSGFLWLRMGLLSLLIGAALMLTLIRGGINLLEAYHQEAEVWLSEQLGTPVSYRELSADLYYFDPRITLAGLRIGGQEDVQESLRVKRIALRLSLWDMLTTGDLALIDLDLKGLAATALPSKVGGWRLLGLPESKMTPSIDVQRLLAKVEQINVEESVLQIQGQLPVTLSMAGLEEGIRLISENGRRVLQGRVSLSADLGTGFELNETISLVARIDSSAASWSGAAVEAYLAVEPQSNSFDIPSQHAVAAELWLTSDQGIGNVKGNIDWSLGIKPGVPTLQLASDVWGDFSLEEQAYALTFKEPELRFDEHALPIGAFGFVAGIDEIDSGVMVAGFLESIAVTDVAIPYLSDFLEAFDWSKESRLRLAEVSPNVELLDLRAIVRPRQFFQSLELVADLQQLSMKMVDTVPGLSGLKGFLSYQNSVGYVDLDAKNVGLHFGNLYDEAWSLQEVRGRLLLRQTETGLGLSSSRLIAKTDQLSAVGKLEMNFAEDRRQRTWGLVIGAEDFALESALPFVPNTVPDTVDVWLESNLMAGRSKKSGLIVHGSLDRLSPKIEKRYAMQVELEAVTLQYADGWPLATNVYGDIQVSNDGVFAAPLTGSIYHTNLSDISLSIPFTQSGELVEVNVAGEADGTVPDLVKLLKETPLKDRTNAVANSWSGLGQVSGSVAVSVPFQSPQQDTNVDVSLEVRNASLRDDALDLDIEALSGLFEFDSAIGLAAKQVTVNMLGGQSIASIDTLSLGEGGIIQIELAGTVELGAVQSWLDLVPLRFTRGSTDYSGRVALPFGAKVDLPSIELETDLQGVTISMPPPFDKASPASKRALTVNQIFDQKGSELSFRLEDGAGGILKLEGDTVIGGAVEIGAYQPAVTAFDAIRITGALPIASLEVWDAFLLELNDYTNPGAAAAFRSRLDSVRVNATTFDLFGYQLFDVNLGLFPGDNRWRMTLQNDQVAGTVQLSDNEADPLDVVLETVDIVADGSDEDPLLGLSVDDLLDADVVIESLMLDGEDYGRWSFKLRPEGEMVRVASLVAETKGMRIDSEDGLRWYPDLNNPRSVFDGEVVVDDMRACLAAWGYASGFEGENFRYQSSLVWPGSPLNLNLSQLEGSFAIEGGKGRIVQAEAGTGALKLLGIFDFAEIAQRFSFDLNNLLSEGHAFNRVTGQLALRSGAISISEPLLVLGAGSQLTIAGEVNLISEVLDNDLILTLPLNKNLPWYAAYSAIATGPLAGAGVMLARQVFKEQINELTSLKYEITGTLSEPEVTFVSMFDDSLREQAQMPTDGLSNGGVEASPGAVTVED